MSLVEALGNPDDGLGLQAREVRENLAMVVEVGVLELVLGEHPAVVPGLRATMSARRGPTCIAVPSRSSSMPIAVVR